MFIQGKLEDAAAAIVSGSFAANNVTSWQINKGLGTNVNKFPCVKVICRSFAPFYKELNIGLGTAQLEIISCGIKAVGDNGQGTSAADFEAVSDYAFNPFFTNNIAANLTTQSTNLQISTVSDAGLEVSTLADGWIATQKLDVVCSRTA